MGGGYGGGGYHGWLRAAAITVDRKVATRWIWRVPPAAALRLEGRVRLAGGATAEGAAMVAGRLLWRWYESVGLGGRGIGIGF